MCYRVFVHYLFVFTQFMFFFTVTDLREATNGLYLFITEFTLAYKLQIYLKKYDRLLVCYDRLNTDLFKPKNDEEKKLVKNGMLNGFIAPSTFFVTAQLFIIFWAISPFIDEDNISKLPLAAWYPYDTQASTLIYLLTYGYQVIACFMTSWANISTDTLPTSMLLHAIVQIELLGVRLSKLGHDNKTKTDEIEYEKKTTDGVNLELTKNRLHEELLECVKFHTELVR